MNKVELFFNYWETQFGPAELREKGVLCCLVLITPIVITILGFSGLVGRIKIGVVHHKRIEFAVDIVTAVMFLLGLGLLVFLIGALIALGKKLKQAFSYSS